MWYTCALSLPQATRSFSEGEGIYDEIRYLDTRGKETNRGIRGTALQG